MLAKAIVPKTVDGFVTYLLWHSMLFTAATPLIRVFRGRWMGGPNFVDFASNTLRRHLDTESSCSVPENYTEEFIHNWGDRGIATMVCESGTDEGNLTRYYRVARPSDWIVVMVDLDFLCSTLCFGLLGRAGLVSGQDRGTSQMRVNATSHLTRWTTLYSDATFLYRDESENPGIDRAFALHAFYGILWVLVAFLQMVPVRKASLDLHRSFGYISGQKSILLYFSLPMAKLRSTNRARFFPVSGATFFLHMWASINNLAFDYSNHTRANRDDVDHNLVVTCYARRCNLTLSYGIQALLLWPF